jgi:hypothetical protein
MQLPLRAPTTKTTKTLNVHYVEECQKHITLSEESAKLEAETMVVLSLVFSSTNPGWGAPARQIRTLADQQKILLAIVAEANEKESSMRSTVLLTPTDADGRTTVSRLDLVNHFPELKMLL